MYIPPFLCTVLHCMANVFSSILYLDVFIFQILSQTILLQPRNILQHWPFPWQLYHTPHTARKLCNSTGQNGTHEERGICYKDERTFGHFLNERVLSMGWPSSYTSMLELKIISSKQDHWSLMFWILLSKDPFFLVENCARNALRRLWGYDNWFQGSIHNPDFHKRSPILFHVGKWQ